MIFKRAIVRGLEKACTIVDRLPGVWIEEDGWYWTWNAQYGCGKMRLAERSFNLDDKWGTGVWKPDE
jgi:hypothetical protein